jgi:seryl-tRNA synthetase
MTTTPQDALTKIRHQIHIVETYIETNPDWLTPMELIHELRAREKALANEIEISMQMERELKQEIKKLKDEVAVLQFKQNEIKSALE